jgi:hypothetical protein
MRWINAKQADLYAIDTSTHAQIPVTRDPTNGLGVVIPGAGTYVFPLGGDGFGGPIVETVYNSLSAKFPAGLAGTITIEGTNFPKTLGGNDQGQADVADDDLTAAWQLIDITQAGDIYAVASGTGNTMTKYTLALAGTNAGGAFWNLPELGMSRLRAKLVATAAGFIRLAINAKLGI